MLLPNPLAPQWGDPAWLVNENAFDPDMATGDLLRNGRLPWGCDGANARSTRFSTATSSMRTGRGARRRSIETAIGSMLRKTFPALRRGRASGSLGDDRVYVYHFPSAGSGSTN
jgi:hypothetical protein